MSDDDWDAIDEDELDKRVAQQKKKNDSSESEEEKPAWQVEQAARPKAKAKTKEKAEFYVPLEDAAEEKKRRQKAVEDADLRLAEDLFAGIDKPEGGEEETAEAAADEKKPKAKKVEVKTVVVDAFDKVVLKTQADVEALSAQCLEKITEGKAKTAGPKFLTDLFKAMEGEMDLKDLQAIDKTLTEIIKIKKTEKADKNTKEAKAQTITKTSGVNVHDELATVYGGGGGDWDEWDDEDWAEWEAQEAKKAAAKAGAKAKAKPKAKATGPTDLAQDFPTL